ncbi:MAG: LLM class flavin-dependent oxidoreductase [candidate division Zixibacteria bacterium]|nr:LLM class flavin-dependent oxidoreductase [candidate division Zixibacteria bacterium]
MSLAFGYCVPIFAFPGSRFFRTPAFERLDPAKALSLGVLADRLGYHSLWVADHLMLGRDQAILEGWTTLSVLAGATSQTRLGIIHQANLFRHPALAAKMAATLDRLSEGRFIWFADPGAAKHEHVAYGLPWSDSTEERAERFEEALRLTLDLWKADRPVCFSGKHYTVDQAVCTPSPHQSPHPPIWIGSTNPVMHRLCARYAQGWNTTPASIEGLRRTLADLETACVEVGRPFGEIEKTLEIQILIAPDLNGIRARLLDMVRIDPELRPVSDEWQGFLSGDTDTFPSEMAESWIVGTPDQVETRIRAYSDSGISHFMLWFLDAPDETGMRFFAETVMPRFQATG